VQKSNGLYSLKQPFSWCKGRALGAQKAVFKLAKDAFYDYKRATLQEQIPSLANVKGDFVKRKT